MARPRGRVTNEITAGYLKLSAAGWFRVRKVLPFNAAAMTGAACAIAIAACATEPSGSGPDSPFQTARDEVVLTRVGIETNADIPYVFRNTTADTVYFVACGDEPKWLIQRLEGWTWRTVYGPFYPDCLDDPIPVAPGAELRETAAIRLAEWPPAGESVAPEEIVGTVRIVWYGVVHHYSPDASQFGVPLRLSQRVSRPFVLRAE